MQYILVAVPYVEEEFTSTWSILHLAWFEKLMCKVKRKNSKNCFSWWKYSVYCLTGHCNRSHLLQYPVLGKDVFQHRGNCFMDFIFPPLAEQGFSEVYPDLTLRVWKEAKYDTLAPSIYGSLQVDSLNSTPRLMWLFSKGSMDIQILSNWPRFIINIDVLWNGFLTSNLPTCRV